jgi:type IV pilus assembly protein PilV
MKKQTQTMNKQSGFSLIEALVAFLILSIGMLGIASLQAISLRAGYTATLRTVATIKAEEIVERMRTNRTGLQSYWVDAGGGLVAPAKICTDAVVPITSCQPDAMAAYDVYSWKQDLLNVFPANTTATIAFPLPVNTAVVPQLPWPVTVTINWKERDPSENAMIDMNYSTTQDICGVTSC